MLQILQDFSHKGAVPYNGLGSVKLKKRLFSSLTEEKRTEIKLKFKRHCIIKMKLPRK